MSLERFERFCGQLVLDNGERMALADFQRIMLRDFFDDGRRETLACIAKGSGKTTLLGAVALFELVTDSRCEGAVVAASRDQAGLLLRQLQGFVQRSPGLSSRVQLKQREAVNRRTGGRFRVLASDVDTLDGQVLSFAVADEVHRWRESERYTILLAGVQKRNGRLFAISTAGIKGEGLLWRMREQAIERGAVWDGAYLGLRGDPFTWHEWALPDDGDWHDLDQVKAANPAPWVTRELLAERFASPSRSELDWRRFSCNQWTEVASDVVIPGELWADRAGEHMPIAPVCFAVDVAPDRSSAAIAVASFDGAGEDRKVGVEIVEHGQGLAWAVERLVALNARHEHVGAIVLDAAGPAGTLIPRLEEFDLDTFAVSAREYARACQGFYDLVVEDRLRHRDQPPLNMAVQAATRRRLTDGWAWSRSKSLSDISPLCAASLAAYGLATRGPVSEEAFSAI